MLNSLSKLIYFSDVISGVNLFFGWVAIVTTVFLVAVIIWWLVILFNPSDEDVIRSVSNWKRLRNVVVPLFLLGWTITVLIPSRQTFILIAGSEVGERVMKSEKVTAIVDPSIDLLTTWIKAETNTILKKAQEKAQEVAKSK